MKHLLVRAAVAAAVLGACATVAPAADSVASHMDQGTYIIIPSGKKDSAKEEANKRLVLAWWREFWDEGKLDSWPKYMAPDFRNHDPREPPVGAQALVDFLKKSRPAQGAAPGPGEGTGRRGVQPQLFALADGDLVFIAHAPPGYDPKHPQAYQGDPDGTFGGNMVRVKDGKIVEWWFTGGGGGVPPTGAAGAAGGPAAGGPAGGGASGPGAGR